MKRKPPCELYDALRTFIRSGSADGVEANRLRCLELVPFVSSIPHKCEDDSCPGDIIRRRLDAYGIAHDKDRKTIKALVAAVRGLLAAHKSYSAEFNPGGKVREVADWGLINEAFLAAAAAIEKAGPQP